MDSQYGIAVTNKFQLFIDEDADPFDIISQQEELKKKEPKEKEKGKSKNKQVKNKPVPQPDAKSKPVEQTAQRKDEKPSNQQVERPPRQDRPPRSARMNKENREEGDRRPRRREENVQPEFREKSDAPPSSFNRPESGRGGGFGRGRGGRGRGGRGRGGFGDRGKRDFERHSGSDRTSGVKPTEKREGGGSHNWGTYKDDLQGEEVVKEAVEAEMKDWNPSEDTENQDPNQSTESTEAPPADDSPHEMTLDEWKAQQEKKRLKSQFNIRKPGEGDGKWQEGKEYRKKSTVSDEEEEDDEDEEEEEDEEAAKNKNLMSSLKFVFSDSPRRGRGGRRVRTGRGGRGGGGRGDRRGGGRDMAPKFDDENDFPSLVKTEA